MGPKYESGGNNIMWTPPYFWCPDPTNWLVTAMTPIWASNDFEYTNKLFHNFERYRFVGISEVVLNFEEADINQCSGDRQLNAYSGTSLCDSTSECNPLWSYGLNTGGYECHCVNGFHYPYGFQGPYRGREMNERNHPLCQKSESLQQFPNWVRKSEGQLSNRLLSSLKSPIKNERNFKLNFRKDDLIVDDFNNEARLDSISRDSNNEWVDPSFNSNNQNQDHLVFPPQAQSDDLYKMVKADHRFKRFLDRRNSFEKLRDSIFTSEKNYKYECYKHINRDIIRLHEDDERFIFSLHHHVNTIFKPQQAQAVRIAHILSAYIQLHSPYGQASFNFGSQSANANIFPNSALPNHRHDPQLEEHLVIAEIISTINAHFPMLEAHVFFNGSEYSRQKLFASQKTIGFGLSAIKTDKEVWLNRSNDDSHLTKTWYKDAVSRYIFGGKASPDLGGAFQSDNEKNFYFDTQSFEANSLSYKFERYSIEMSLRKSFDGISGSTQLPVKYYDAASSGVWFGPFYDCQKPFVKPETSVRMSYSVPIIISSNKPPVGLVTIVVGSDLKWWRINPCDSTNGRNMFQSLHKCDAETTYCMPQDVPEYENGFYLASYRCVCKVNYEYPYIDTGANYFEGSIVEKEFEKKIQGQANIYDRLKCRPVLDYNRPKSHGNVYNSACYLSLSFFSKLLIFYFLF